MDKVNKNIQIKDTEEIKPQDLPFYYDPQTHIELGGKKPWKKEIL